MAKGVEVPLTVGPAQYFNSFRSEQVSATAVEVAALYTKRIESPVSNAFIPMILPPFPDSNALDQKIARAALWNY